MRYDVVIPSVPAGAIGATLLWSTRRSLTVLGEVSTAMAGRRVQVQAPPEAGRSGTRCEGMVFVRWNWPDGATQVATATRATKIENVEPPALRAFAAPPASRTFAALTTQLQASPPRVVRHLVNSKPTIPPRTASSLAELSQTTQLPTIPLLLAAQSSAKPLKRAKPLPIATSPNEVRWYTAAESSGLGGFIGPRVIHFSGRTSIVHNGLQELGDQLAFITDLTRNLQNDGVT